MKQLIPFSILLIISFSLLFSSCSDDDLPPLENEEEVVNLVRLTFTKTGSSPLVFEATDPDGEGPNDFVIPQIALAANTTYTLAIDVENTQSSEVITEEIEEEAGEHMFFFAWTANLFSDPQGDGNIDNRADAMNYADEDDAGLPLGLLTTWTTSDIASGAIFRMVLKHQPDVKTATSTSSDGETDIDLTWSIIIE